jgi:hypothetical protein
MSDAASAADAAVNLAHRVLPRRILLHRQADQPAGVQFYPAAWVEPLQPESDVEKAIDQWPLPRAGGRRLGFGTGRGTAAPGFARCGRLLRD